MATAKTVSAVRSLEGSASLTDHDIYLFREGTFFRAYDKLGAHLLQRDGVPACTRSWARTRPSSMGGRAPRSRFGRRTRKRSR